MLFNKISLLHFFTITTFFIHTTIQTNKPFLARTYVKERMAKNYSFVINDIQKINTDEHSYALNFLPLYFSTMNDEKFSRIFMINNKHTTSAIGDNLPRSALRDIDPIFIGGNNDTNENLTLNSSANYFAIRGIAQFSLGSLLNSDFFKDFAVGIRSSFINSKHNITLKSLSDYNNENINTFFSSYVKNAIIPTECYSNNGLESIDITLESFYQGLKNHLFIYYYSGLSLPIPWDELDSANIFPTTIGNDGHLGLLMGVQAYCRICSIDSVDIGGFLEVENNFLIYRTKKRTFDLYNKQWSKYLPALNILYPDTTRTIGEITTLPVRVHPGFNLDFSVGPSITFKKNDYTTATFSAGYNLWYTSDEYIELRDYAEYEDYQKLYYYGIKGSDNSHTASQSTIAQHASNDTDKTPLNINLLDLNSGAASGGKSNTFFVRCALENDSYHGIIGAWIEGAKEYYIQSRYGLWAGFGFLW